ncbi:hypothetical protein AA0111_g7850 [Alternaria arborescens]|uniref:hypothetical protein n=1 Tax=Alternaria arborescens TaxID=156630 RepID=UPI001074A725|nr:hypothetical protein AA0111_g7850 [Alternaria arborescens]RYO26792.1 hypothetical protein AA0111_g7850 [Alternaria arborescens]
MLHIAPKLCPTVFNRPIRFGESVYSSVTSSDVRFDATQVFNSLHKAYGKTLDPHLTSQDPFYAVSEVYSFAAAAENQFLNMMRNILDNRIESIVRESLQSKNSTHDALPERANIQYDRTILDAHSDRISNVIAFLKAADDPVWFPNVDHHDRREAVRARTSLVHDFQHLHAQIIQLIQRCERAMDMVAHNASLLEAKRSNLQSEGLEKLTRLTTIVTLLYVPLSFVCTFFGMNFSTFGQGKLSLWIWAAVSAPVMLVSLVFLRRMLKNDSKKTRL